LPYADQYQSARIIRALCRSVCSHHTVHVQFRFRLVSPKILATLDRHGAHVTCAEAARRARGVRAWRARVACACAWAWRGRGVCVECGRGVVVAWAWRGRGFCGNDEYHKRRFCEIGVLSGLKTLRGMRGI
jgi:hypothetical protein